MAEGEVSYYAILNVAPDANEGEIRRAYRQLAQHFHPDKHTSDEMRQTAAEGFARINEAYEVLSNAQQRQVYDIYGKQGLVAGLDVGTKLKTVEELRAQWEKFRAQKSEEAGSNSNYETVLHCTLDGRSLFEDKGLDRLTEIAMHNCWIQTTVSQTVGKRNSLVYMGGNMIVTEADAGGNLLMGFKSNLTSVTGIEGNASWGMKSGVLVSSTQQITDNTYGSMIASWSAQEGAGLQFNTSRNVAVGTRSTFAVALGPPSEAGAHLSLAHNTDKASLTGKIQVGRIYSVSARANYALSENVTARAAGKFGLTGIDLDLGAIRRLSPNSTVSLGVVVGIQGTIFKIKWTSGGFQLDIPILLSRNVRDWKVALAAYTLPPLVISAAKYLIVGPILRKIREREALATRREHAESIRREVDAAKSAQTLMRPVSTRMVREEASKGGLVVVKAEYGVFDTYTAPASTMEDGSERLDLPPPYIDVTCAVQYSVNSGRLELHEGVAKSGLMGFCDPSPEQEKRLRIKYIWKNRVYEVEIGDLDCLNLPSQGTLIQDVEGAEEVMNLAKHLGVWEEGESSNRRNSSPLTPPISG